MSQSSCKTIKTTCAYCGVGCGIEASVNETERQVLINGDDNHPANFGRLCSKGSSLGETIDVSSRLLTPYIGQQATDWNTALDAVASTFSQIIAEHGPDSVAIYGSGQLLTEDYYVANKLMKGFIGSANIDTNSRLCMSSAVSGHKRAFGTDTVPNCYDDLELADLVVITGSNMAWCHPISYQRIRAAKAKNPNMRVVVIDPRRTATCDIADLHLPLAGGSDVVLFNGLLNHLVNGQYLQQEYIDNHTQGFAEAVAAAQQDAGDLAEVALRTRLSERDLVTFYNWFAETDKVVTAYSQGVKQSSSGVDKVNSILNCHLATGRIGKPGAGPLSMTGQPNAMGGREVGGLATTLAAHMEFNIDGDTDRVARFWNAANMATKPGLPAVELFEAIAAGKIKAVWIMATNPVVSLPNADQVKAALQQCPFVVVSDCVANTDTLELAHIKLPAQGWSEKDGIVTNSERRLSHQRALLPPAGEAKPDWWIISQVGQRLGFKDAFNYQHQVEIFREHAALSGFENSSEQRLRDFDISAFANISQQQYEDFEPIQWPVNQQYPNGKERFFADGQFYTPNRKANFIALTGRAPGNLPDQEYPLVLNTGRLRDQWHTMTRSALAPRLNQHRPEPFVEVNPQDAAKYGLKDGHIAHLQSRWGQMYARVNVSESQVAGDVFVPMHWTEQYASKGRMGAVVNPVVDPVSGQPESKHTPIRIAPYQAEWHGFVLSRQPLPDAGIDYQVKVNCQGYLRYELAGYDQSSLSIDWVKQWLSQVYPALSWQYLDDAKLGLLRVAGYQGNSLMFVLCIATTPDIRMLPERNFLSSLFAKSQLQPDERLALLSGLPTAGAEDTGAQVCACFNVGEKTIRKAIRENGLTSYQEVGKCCKAGTNCGSCVPEIKTILASMVETQPA
ncbi:molybdopterin-dependent oxidoreductase [Neiella sp. HB171785]|uniref:Molybdopterin-dependent oxidoreductase n=1 Tax=Neiella litorisoli TaxID=2771431 RepID=A0A8J6UMX7_9GAMM|nr:nitrate reductase [Neiella litorisoli]MBD1391215.1 molybdopterin-dependent oxidoreductase [Neiella litorisoli]